MMYPLRVWVCKDDFGSEVLDEYNHGVHEGVVTLINKIRSRHPEIDPDHRYHLYPQLKDGRPGTRPASNALSEDGITFLEDCGVDQTDQLFYRP